MLFKAILGMNVYTEVNSIELNGTYSQGNANMIGLELNGAYIYRIVLLVPLISLAEM